MGSGAWHLYLIYFFQLIALAALIFLLLATFRAQNREAREILRVQWELYEARRNATQLQLATTEFLERGNWLLLASALDRPLTSSLSTLAQRLENESHLPAANAFETFCRLSTDVYTTVTYALALHAHGLDLPPDSLPSFIRQWDIASSDESTSPILFVERSRSILRSTDLYIKFVQLGSILDSLADITLTAWNTESERHEHFAHIIAVLILVVLGSGAVFPLWVRHRVKHRTELTKAIVELGERLSAARSLREAAEALVKVADRLMGWDACGVSLYDREKDATRDVLWVDTIEGKKVEVTNESRLNPLTPLRRRVIRGEKLLFVNPLPPTTERQRFGAKDKPSQSLMFVPVWSENHVVALVTLQSYKPYAYTENDLALLEWLAARLGAAIERAEVYEKLERSEEQYRKLVETSLDGVFMIDTENIYFVNNSFARIFGYDSPEQIIGKLRPADLISPADLERVREMVVRRLRGEASGETILWRGRRKDGSEILVESQGTAVSFRGMIVDLGTVRDVTEREQAREKMEALQRIYTRAIEAAGAVPYRLNFRTGEYVFTSEAIKDLTGFDPSELTWEVFRSRTQHLVQIYPATREEEIREIERLSQILPPTETQHRRRLHDLLTGEAKMYRAEVRFQRKDGKFVWLLDSAVIEEDEHGTPVGALGILQDITREKRLRQRSELLAKITADLAAAKTAREAACFFIQHVREFWDFDSCFIRLYDKITDKFIHLYAEDTIDGQRVEVVTPPDVSETARRVLQGESVFVLRDDDQNMSEPFISFGNGARRSLSIMIVPLCHGDRIIGIVGIHSYSRNAFTAEDFEDFRQLCAQCAAGLEHVLTFQRLAESEEQLRTLWVNTPVGIRLTDAEGVIWMVNPAYCQLVGLREDALIGKPFSHVYTESEREHLLRKYQERFAAGTIEEEVTRDLKLWDGTEKVFHVISRFVKTRDGLMLLSLVTDRTEEVRLTRELEQKKKELELLATHDTLTGLKNRRLVLELMQHEIERARRYRFPLCVIMLDIDHFKHVNDTYGHLVGDEVLRQFAKILENNTRAVDIVGRYGGEEFVIVMPETGLDGALVSAERIRSAVEKHDFSVRPDLTLHITCSLGVTQGEPELLDIDQLLAVADKALYCAKMEGRNRVSVA